MSGALKHFFDGIYYPCLEATRRRPYGLYVHGGIGHHRRGARGGGGHHRPGLASDPATRHRHRATEQGRTWKPAGSWAHCSRPRSRDC